MNNRPFQEGIARELAKHNNPDVSEENYTVIAKTRPDSFGLLLDIYDRYRYRLIKI